jgi:hypothetical protein
VSLDVAKQRSGRSIVMEDDHSHRIGSPTVSLMSEAVLVLRRVQQSSRLEWRRRARVSLSS